MAVSSDLERVQVKQLEKVIQTLKEKVCVSASCYLREGARERERERVRERLKFALFTEDPRCKADTL